MKRLFLFTFLLTLLLILSGCDNGSVSDSAVSKSSRLVKVSLAVSGDESGLQKAAVVDGSYWTSLTYQYNAVPQWQDPEGNNIHGAAGWTTISYSAGELSLGYFAPGQWVFGVRILNGATVLYEGFSPVVDIKNSSVSVDVFVTKLAESVRISVTAPTAQGDSLSISYGNGAFGPFKATATRLDGTTTFEYTFNNLSAGSYTFTFTYSSVEGSPASNSITVEVSSGKLVVISGQLNNGSLQLEPSTVIIYRIYIERYDWESEQFKRTGSGNYYGNVISNTVSAVAGDLVSFYVDNSLEPGYPEVNEGAILPTNNGSLYSFVMPESDAIVKVKFTQRGDTAISLDSFKKIIQALYDSYPGVKAFGRSDNPPNGVEYVGIGEVSVWYAGTKIYWYSTADDNTVKFIPTTPVGTPTRVPMKGFFKDNDKFESIDLTGFNTSNINDMSELFYNCANLKTVNMGNIDTSAVTDMSYMFYKAGFNYFPYHDTGLNPNNADRLTPNVPSDGFPEGTYLQISGMNFDTSAVIHMSHMFNLCSANNLSGTNIALWNVKKVKDMDYMFAGNGTLNSPYLYWYNKFESLPISNWQTIACETFERMFNYCNVLETVDMTNWSFANVTSMNRMFDRCESLTDIVFPTHTDLTKMKDMTAMFFHCGKITYTTFNNNVFTRWDITNTVLYGPDPADPETVEGKGFNLYNNNKNDTPNRIFTNDMHTDLKSCRRSFVTYGTGPGVGGVTVKIGGGNLNHEKWQRLVIE